jgi:dihydroorotate dehydrogenase electron transfer subunit
LKLLETAKVETNRRITGSYYLLRLAAPQVASAALPGQFIMVKIGASMDPLLRRPFSIMSVSGETVEVCYKVVGRGTELLSSVAPGDKLSLLGPLGREFKLRPPEGKIALIGGGIGLPPLLFLAESIKEYLPGRMTDLAFLIGCESEADILFRQRLESLSCKVEFATEDGSVGFCGLVTERFSALISNGFRPSFFYACGPHAMLAALKDIARKAGLKGQVSLESRMACGVGACLGCAIDSAGSRGAAPKKYVCSDGPVFDIEEVDLNE